MTKAQELQVRELEIRESINKLLGMPEADRPDDYSAQLDAQTAAMAKLTPELRAALAAEPEPEIRIVQPGDAETRERRGLAGKTGIAEFLAAAAGGRAVTGAAAEYAATCKVPDVGRIPMAIFEDGRLPETRAITGGPAVVGPPQPTVPYVFERSAAAALGIMMPTVPAGQVQIPRVTAAPPVDTLAKDGAAPRPRRPSRSTAVRRSGSPGSLRFASKIWPCGRSWKTRCPSPSVAPCRTSWTRRRSTARRRTG